MQTILGAGGAIGTPLAKELINYTSSIRLVSRNPVAVNPTDELVSADLNNATEVDKAVEGSSVVYLVAGLPYSTKIWQKQWPVVMQNVITSCKKYNAKLVFFDNIYMYDKNYISNATEETPTAPCSKKGVVRAEIAQMILDAIGKGELKAAIVRASDFLGPKNSVLVEMVYKNLKKGKKGNWMADANRIHSFTFTPDAAKATALIGNTDSAYNQVWHAPTSSQKLTGKQWVELFAKEMNVAPRYSVLPVAMMPVLGIFVPVLREFKEMAYQYQLDYFFNSSKFEREFGIQPTSPTDAVRWVINNVK